mmetsp:Transcript_587/g.1253  ORF Transcript_587/g.1253 Transcript_587/m.1253 type:complete len:87 (-) Transcript_587:86-346(-)
MPMREKVDGLIHRHTSQSMQLSSTYKFPGTFCLRAFLKGAIAMLRTLLAGLCVSVPKPSSCSASSKLATIRSRDRIAKQLGIPGEF